MKDAPLSNVIVWRLIPAFARGNDASESKTSRAAGNFRGGRGLDLRARRAAEDPGDRNRSSQEETGNAPSAFWGCGSLFDLVRIGG
jgi:hypothetical protein